MNLDREEKKFLEDLVKYSNELYGEGSRKALSEGVPSSDPDLEQDIKLILDKDGEYSDALEGLKEKGVIEETTTEKEMHRSEGDKTIRETEEKTHIQLIELDKVLEKLETDAKGGQP